MAYQLPVNYYHPRNDPENNSTIRPSPPPRVTPPPKKPPRKFLISNLTELYSFVEV